MQRWVNDYNLAEKMELGYRPVLPFMVKDVGGGTQAILLEMAEVDYRFNQTKKQIKNDRNTPMGGSDLDNYKADLFLEAQSILSRKITRWQMVTLAVRKIFNLQVGKYVATILNQDAAKRERTDGK